MKKCRTDRITSTLAQKKKHRLFISHAEKDATIVKAFVELLYRIGLNEDDIFCSSISEIGVPIRYECFILGKHTARNGVAGISPPRREFQKC